MVRRLVLLGTVVLLLSLTSALGVINREIGGGGARGSGGGGLPSGPVLLRPGFIEEEPYRNPDMGPLGVVLSNGEFQLSVTDLEIPGRGTPFRLTRTYRSRKDLAGSPLGYGWHLSTDETLRPGRYVDAELQTRPAIQWTMGDGWRELWVDADGAGYRPFGGFYGKMRSLAAGKGYQIRTPEGTVKTFGLSMVRQGESDPVWVLTRIEDRNGNALTLQYRPVAGSALQLLDTVTDTLGRTISFSYDASHRLTAVTDFAGRRIDYAYDAFDNLVSVKSPEVTGTPNGNDFCDSGCPEPRKTATYRYAAEDGCAEGSLIHNLTAVTSGKGTRFLTNRYAAAWDAKCGEVTGSTQPPYDFIREQQYGDGTVRYDYRFTGDTTPGPETVILETTVTDRNGNVRIHSFNNQGSPVRIVSRTNRGVRQLAGSDEGDYTVTYRYVEGGGGLISRRTESGGINVDSSGRLAPYASGMTVEYQYDQSNPDIFQRGNLLSVIRTPDPERGGGQASLATSTTFEPLFNQPIAITDPRGHVTELTYDFQEGGYANLIAGNPAPAAVDPAWWSAGEIEAFLSNGALAGLGDLNGDGYHRGGNLVRVAEGAITHADGTVSGEIATTIAYNGFGQPAIRRDAEHNETHFEYFAESDPDGDGSPTPAPRDGRILSSLAGAEGGGYVSRQIRDATPAMPLPLPPPDEGRESGQNPPPGNIATDYTYDPVGNARSVTDGRGIRTDYFVNALNQVLQITRAAASADPAAPAFGIREQSRYDAANNLVQRRLERRDDGSTLPADRWITTDITYDGLDRKTAETITTDDTPALSLTTRYAYDGNGNLRKTIYPEGNALLRFYDERDLLFREVALRTPSPDPEAMGYDPAADSVTRYDYDGAGDVIQVTDPEGHAARTGYDGYNRKLAAFDPLFQKTLYTLDAGGDVTAQVTRGLAGGATPAPPGEPPAIPYPELSSLRFYRDELGHLRRTDTKFFRTDGATQVLLHTDSDAGLASSPDPVAEPVPVRGDGWTTSLIRYDRLGRPVIATDDNGHSTETRYDGLGRRIAVLLSPVAPFTYAPGGPDERSATEFGYDAAGNLTSTLEREWGSDRSDPAAPARKLPAQSHRTTFRYDSLNRLVETVVAGREGAPPLDLTTRMAYDSRGNRIQVTDPAGRRTHSFFDGAGRLARTEEGVTWDGTAETVPPGMITPSNPDGLITTRFVYDRNGRLTSRVDDNGRATLFEHDALNRQTRTTYPDGSWRSSLFDRDSLAIRSERGSVAGARLAVTTRYDGLHRAVGRDVDATAAPEFTGTRRQEFEYDGLGRMTRAEDDSDLTDAGLDSDVRLAYNSLGKVILETEAAADPRPGQPPPTTLSVTSSYDGTGFRIRVVYPGGRSVVLLPDALNRPGTLLDSYTGATRYDYLGPARLLNRIHPNGTRLTLLSGPADDGASGYDDARRMVDLATRAKGAAAPVAEFAYGYDRSGNRLFERRVHEPAGPDWMGETYEYDAAGRLAKRWEGSLNSAGELQGGGPAAQGFVLDGPGNWTSTKRLSTTFDNRVNALNQYTRFGGPQGTLRLGYDFAGDLTAESGPGGDRQYAYDFAGRLVSFLDVDSNLAAYRYDALGRRIFKTLDGRIVTRFLYDGDRLVEERDGAGALVASYLNGPGTDEVISRRRWTAGAWADLFYHTNALGSVTAVTGSTGTVVERYRYDAFGQVTFLDPASGAILSSAVFNNLLFTGRYYDPESRLYDYRARTYHPYLGRFLQRDPLGEAVSPNLYAYAAGNPINATDPTGLFTFSLTPGGRDLQRAWDGRFGSGGGWSLQQKMAYRQGHYVDHVNAEFGDFEAAQKDEDEWAEVDRQNDEWEAKRARVAAHDVRNQVKESLAKSQDNMAAPKGIVVVFDGFNQSILDEHSGAQDFTELDNQADTLRGNGFVVIEVNSDDMARAFLSPQVAEAAVDFVADAVQEVSANAGGDVPIAIEGFSRGAGPAVALTNALTDAGMNERMISTYLIDPYMPRGGNVINSSLVGVHTYFSSYFSWVRPAAWVGGYIREVVHGRDRQAVPGSTYGVFHGQMDSYDRGVLGLVDQQILGAR